MHFRTKENYFLCKESSPKHLRRHIISMLMNFVWTIQKIVLKIQNKYYY